jgi:membrane protein DedA with SNARE-associated domain
MNDFGKVLVFIGLAIAAIGALMWAGLGHWLGKLPGDVNYQRGNFSLHFPIVTCLIISIVITVLMWLFRR